MSDVVDSDAKRDQVWGRGNASIQLPAQHVLGRGATDAKIYEIRTLPALEDLFVQTGDISAISRAEARTRRVPQGNVNYWSCEF